MTLYSTLWKVPWKCGDWRNLVVVRPGSNYQQAAPVPQIAISCAEPGFVLRKSSIQTVGWWPVRAYG